jgi:selenocysteine-specific elongation factor
MITIGGGVVLTMAAKPLRKKDRMIADSLDYLMNSEGADLISRHLNLHPLQLFTERDLAVRFSIPEKRVRNYIAELNAAGRIVQIDRYWTSQSKHSELKAEILKLLQNYHRQRPLAPGMTRTELLDALEISAELLNYLLQQLCNEQAVKISGEKVARYEFRIAFSDVQRQFIESLERDLKQAEFNPPDLKEIHRRSPLSAEEVQLIVAFLLDENRIVQIDRDKFLHCDAINEGEKRIRDYLTGKQSATVSELKEVLNTSRKWAVPILNYYDKIGLTTRIGDQRELRKE